MGSSAPQETGFEPADQGAPTLLMGGASLLLGGTGFWFRRLDPVFPRQPLQDLHRPAPRVNFFSSLRSKLCLPGWRRWYLFGEHLERRGVVQDVKS